MLESFIMYGTLILASLHEEGHLISKMMTLPFLSLTIASETRAVLIINPKTRLLQKSYLVLHVSMAD